MTRFLLIRHATNDTIGKKLAGRMPGVHLNEEGRSQAQRLARQLTGLSISAIYSSPLERAIETAAPIARVHHLETIVRDEFNEINFGLWTGNSFDTLHNDPQFNRFNSFRSCTAAPGGELMSEAQIRMVKGLDKLRQQHPNETVAVVGHGDPIRAAIAYYTGIHLDMFMRIEISLASVSIVEVDESWVRIPLINHTGNIQF